MFIGLSRIHIIHLLALIFLIAGIRISRAEVACDEPVKTAYGPVAGYREPDALACGYKGIPYAAPPTGELRWKSPQPPPAHREVLKADKYGPWCVQPIEKGLLTASEPETRISEDCLYLNIWRPQKRGTFPVMFWIHGGGLETGGGATPMYRGDRLAAAQDVVVVTINYRLRVFGFLALPELAREDPHQSAGDYGLLDQIAALKWVRENISAFGGDPGNITIFGESAGGWSVCNMLASPLTGGLFAKAIIQSGGCDTTKTMAEGYEDGERFAKYLGCSGPAVLSCLRNKSVKEIEKVSKKFDNPTSLNLTTMLKYPWIPKQDGWALKETPIESLRSGQFHQVPLLIGSDRDEAKIFSIGMPGIRLAPAPLVRVVLKKSFGAELTAGIEKLYPYRDYQRPADAAIMALGDATLACKCFDAAEAASSFQPIYYYRFDYDDHLAPRKFGAGHGIEIPFIFDTFDMPQYDVFFDKRHAQDAKPLSGLVMSYWANFARTGNPNGPGLMDWPAYDSEHRMRIYFDRSSKIRTTDNVEKCEFWRKQNIQLK